MSPKKLLRLAFLATIVSLTPAFVWAQQSSRVRVDADLNGKDPFAIRAGASQRPALTPATPTQNRNSTPRTDETAASGAPNDVLYVRDAKAPLACVVTTISGSGGLTALVQNEPKTFSLGSIERVELSVSDEFRRGVDAFESGKRTGAKTEFERALELFKTARQTSERRLEKEWATAKIVETYSALGRDDEAASEFFLLCRLDPYSPYLASAPLRWVNQTTLKRGSSLDSKNVAEATAAQWLALKDNPSGTFNPTGRLLAASILLNSSQHSKEAVAAMQALVALEPPDDADEDAVETCRAISLLATEQLWRAAVLRKPTEREVAHWSKTIEATPGELTLGPEYLVALGQKSLGQDDLAARTFLRVAALASDRFALAEAATRQAADAYERLGQADVAQKIRADLTRRFSE
ncbi:MAG: hypothetical protein IKX88_14680 [Thermoguttaceae bacterium]|nr:hypothetical protein [Thermoguttaceae bacterium]